MTTKNDRAKAIRSQLKTELGANARQISVRVSSYSLGCTIRVLVKSARFGLADVDRIARAHENLRRCEYSGEILMGGNAYVDVEYAREATATLTAYLEARLDALAPGEVAPVGGLNVAIDADGYVRSVDGKLRCYGTAFGAHQIATAILNGAVDLRAAAVELDRAQVAGHDVTDAMARVMALLGRVAA